MLHTATAPPSMSWMYAVMETFMAVFPVVVLLVGFAGVVVYVDKLGVSFKLWYLQRLLLWAGFTLGAVVLVGWVSFPTLSFNILPELGVNTILLMISPEVAAVLAIVAGALILAGIVVHVVRLVRRAHPQRPTPALAR